jgi:hypothetical protein
MGEDAKVTASMNFAAIVAMGSAALWTLRCAAETVLL